MNLSRYYNQMLAFPAVLTVIALGAILLWPLHLGLDLSGGTLLQVSYPDGRPTVEQVQKAIAPLELGEVRVQQSGADGFVLRAVDIDVSKKTSVVTALGTLGTVHEDLFTSISPTIGKELLNKGLIALGLVAVCIILFIAFAFRHVSRPVASWKYGIIAIISLLHDVLVPVGLFAVLGHFAGAEVDSLFIVALLTILGISINDKIVVFDRIRENLRIAHETKSKETFGELVGHSIVQTLTRSINTSLTVVIMLVALYLVGPASTQTFALTLIVGMIAGTYSSILLACPLLVLWEKWQRKN